MVELQKDLRTNRDDSQFENVYDVAEFLIDLYFKDYRKVLSYKKLEILLFEVWCYKIERGFGELFKQCWKVSYDRVMPLELETEDELRRRLSMYDASEYEVSISRDNQNMLQSICLGDGGLFCLKSKAAKVDSVEKLDLLGFSNFNVITSAMYEEAFECQKKKIEEAGKKVEEEINKKEPLWGKIAEFFFEYDMEEVIRTIMIFVFVIIVSYLVAVSVMLLIPN